jgi:hypothetical protein
MWSVTRKLTPVYSLHTAKVGSFVPRAAQNIFTLLQHKRGEVVRECTIRFCRYIIIQIKDNLLGICICYYELTKLLRTN